jgi:chromosome segregation ATPase
MTTEIDTILNAIAATGATESSDPLREYITSIESASADLTAANESLTADNAALTARAEALDQQVADLTLALNNLRGITGDARAAAVAVINAAQTFLNGTPA